MSDCLNDCRAPVAFPRRIDNRPGLAHIGYRIGTYADIREALMHWLNADPAMRGFTHRKSDDPAIALLEGAAVVGDVLTFYQELYANEKFLRTAAWRESVADLVRLLGYRLAPGVGGRATFAFEVRGALPVNIPQGYRVSAEVTGREGQSDFETVEAAVAYPALSHFPLYRPPAFPNIAGGTSRFSVDTAAMTAAGVTLEKGDRLMVAVNPASAGTSRQIVVVEAVRPQFERTEITIRGSWLGPTTAAVSAWKLGRSFRFFGYNAPPKVTVINSSGTATQNDVPFWHQTMAAPGWPLFLLVLGHNPLPTLASFPLDTQVDDLAVGGLLLVTLPLGISTTFSATTGEQFFETRIQNVHRETLTRGALTGGTTVVDLDRELGFPASFPMPLIYTDIRAVHFHEVRGERFELKSARAELATSDPTRLFYYGDAVSYAALNGRRVQLARGATVEHTVLATDPAATPTGTTLRPLTLGPALSQFNLADFPLEAPTVIAYGNLVDATQGRSEREAVLGNGDSRQSFQTFKLPKSPLTYHAHAGSTPPEQPELEIYVGERQWTQVPSFYGHGPLEEIFIVREDANGDSWVQFGNDETGARLPSGIGNIRAFARTGNGAWGPLREGTNVLPGARLDRLDKIRLHGLATGGDVSEDADNARAAAPGKIQSLGRLVSLADFETEALSIAGVWRVSARWANVSNVPAMVLTILTRTGGDVELAAVRAIFAEYNRCRGPQRFPIIVNGGRLEFLFLRASVALDPVLEEAAVLSAIRAALGISGDATIEGSRGLMATGRRRFGEREYATRVAGIIQNVPGVMWARVDGLGTLGIAGDPATLIPPAPPWPFDDIIDCAPDRILALDARHVELAVLAVPGKVCE